MALLLVVWTLNSIQTVEVHKLFLVIKLICLSFRFGEVLNASLYFTTLESSYNL